MTHEYEAAAELYTIWVAFGPRAVLHSKVRMLATDLESFDLSTSAIIL